MDDPAARGLGLFETMRSRGGEVPWLDDHLHRMERSARELALEPFPPRRRIEAAVDGNEIGGRLTRHEGSSCSIVIGTIESAG